MKIYDRDLKPLQHHRLAQVCVAEGKAGHLTPEFKIDQEIGVYKREYLILIELELTVFLLALL